MLGPIIQAIISLVHIVTKCEQLPKCVLLGEALSEAEIDLKGVETWSLSLTTLPTAGHQVLLKGSGYAIKRN